MNLNGANSKSTTILNGKPLYGYDRAKRITEEKHGDWHERVSKYSRTHIGKTKMISKGSLTKTNSINVIVVVIFLIVIAIFILQALFAIVFSLY